MMHNRRAGKHIKDDHYTLQDNGRIREKLDEHLPLGSVSYNGGLWTLERVERQKRSMKHNSIQRVQAHRMIKTIIHNNNC